MKTINVAASRRMGSILFMAALTLFLLGVTLVPLSVLASRAEATAVRPTDGGRAYVAMSDSNAVAMIDTATHMYLDSIYLGSTGCSYPWHLSMSPDTAYVYVTCYLSGQVIVVDTANSSVEASVSHPYPSDVTFVQGGSYALVGTTAENQLAVIDTTTFALFQTIPLPSFPLRLAAHSFLDRVYITQENGTVLVMNSNSFAIMDTIYVGGSPWDVAVSPDGQRLFVGDQYSGGLHVIETATNTLITTIHDLYGLGSLDITPDGNTLFATTPNGVYVIDIATLSLTTTISGPAIYGVALNCNGTELYLGDGYDSVPVFDTVTYDNIVNIPVSGYGAREIVICPEFVLSGVTLLPQTQTNSGALGETVVHQLALYNATDTADSYDIALGAYTWGSALSTTQVGPLQPGESITFTVSVTIPLSVEWYDTDSVDISATSVTSPTVYSDTVTVTTRAYASAQISVFPDAFSSDQEVHEIITQQLSISNGNGVTLTYDITARPDTLDVITQLGHGRSDNEIQALLAQAGQAEDEHNTGLPTIGRYTPAQLRQLQGPVNILAWTLYTDYYEEYANTLNAIAQYTPYTLAETTTTDPAQLAALLQQADVFLVPEQEYAHYTLMYNLGQSWQNVLNNFLSEGGSIVVMEHYLCASGLFAGAGLMDVASATIWDIIPLNVANPDHPLAQGLPSSFMGVGGISGYYSTSGQTIITAGSDNFVNVAVDEIHNGRIALVGLDFYGYNDEMARLLANAVLWGNSGVPWLHTVPVSGSVATNDTAVVNVVMDAANLQPGAYAANLQISHNDETQNSLLLPVTMTVQPTANMGWVEGIVTDAGTGLPLAATITAQGQPYTITADANTGYYKLWLDQGNYTLQVSADGYVPETQSVGILAQQGSTQNFDLVLNVPVLTVNPDSFAVTHQVGDVSVETLTLGNAGPAALEFEWRERAGDFTPLTSPGFMVAPPRRTPEAGSLTAVSSPTAPMQPPLADLSRGLHTGTALRVLLAPADNGDVIQNILQSYPGLLVDYYDARSGTPALTELLPYDVVFTWGYVSYNDSHAMGNVLADYVDAGGAVVISVFSWGFPEGYPWHVGGRFASEGYNPFVSIGQGNHETWADLGSHLLHPLMTDVTAVSDYYRDYVALASGATLIASWSDGEEFVALKDNVVALNSYIGDDYSWSGDIPTLVYNSIVYLAGSTDVPWLFTNPTSGTVAGYSSQPVQVTFDATGLQPGTYTASLLVLSNDLANSSQAVPVTMTVSPAPGMGHVMGDVTDLWTGQPLSATVQLVGVYTATAVTAYSIWADPGSYTLVASADGYMTGVYTVTLPANGVVVQDIALEPAQPRLDEMPNALTITAIPNLVFSQTFTIANTGPLPLVYQWHEVAPSQPTLNAPADLNGKNILYDYAHGQYDISNYSILAAAINNAGGLLTTNFAYPITANILEGVDVLWVDCCGNMDWTFVELQVVNTWLEAGGAVLVHSTNYPAATDVAGIYNITYQCCSFSHGTTTDILPHPTTVDVNAIYLDYSYDSLNYPPAAVVTVRDTNGYAQVVAQEQNGGKMVVIDSHLFNDYRINYADNHLFALNVLNWLAAPAYGDVTWLAVSPTSGTIPGHSTQEVTMIVDTTGLALGAYEATLALEHNDPARLSPIMLPVSLVVAEQTAAVSLTPATAADSAAPGAAVTYNLTVRNTGSGPDMFDIVVSGDWPASASILSTGQLLPNQTQQFTVVVNVPATAAPGSTDSTMVLARSHFDPVVSFTAVLTTSVLDTISGYAIYLPVVLKP